MAPHSSTLAWKIPGMEEPGRLQSMGSLRVGHYESVATERLHFHFPLSRNGEGNGNPLQCSCLENPRDGRGWWAAVYGVAQSQTQLKRLSSSSWRTRTRISSVLNLSWRIPDEPPRWKVVAEPWRHQDSWPLEERNSIQSQWGGLITQSFCVIKFY